MFEADLIESLKTIFGLPKVSLNTPGEVVEQNTLFVQIENSKHSIKDAKQTAKVTGRLSLYAPHEKVPYGFFSKRIAEADPDLTAPFYFFEFEENTGTFVNIAERSLGFVYFFNGQYNPRVGTITSLTVESEE